MKKKIRQCVLIDKIPEWEKLLSVQSIFQDHFPECVLVGGTAASLHAKHRISIDADYVLPDLKRRFEELLSKVEEEAGWQTKVIKPPVLILGHFLGVRTGVRQLIRKAPLETTIINGFRIPTADEMLRIKAYLIVRRNTARDFIDFIAMFDHLGVTNALEALESLDHLYPQPPDGTTISQQLAIQLAEPKPWDLSTTDLAHYKAIQPPYSDWREIKRRTLAASQKIMTHQFE